MQHTGGCHCGNLRIRLELTHPPAVCGIRSCRCSFCRAHATRTVSDPAGLFEVWADDWERVEAYRFGSRTADYLVCRRCGVYVGAVCETAAGLRAVTNTNALHDRDAFILEVARPEHEGETMAARMARRAANWTPTVLFR